jgi:indole-3-glycerol phosphate synthase
MSAGRPDLLAAIVEATRHRVESARARRPVDRLRAKAGDMDGVRSLSRALAPDGVRIIAECKRRSPSRGILRHDYDAAAIASAYQRAGAAAISVLTEPAFFDGSLSHLEEVRRVVDLPVLRKDFTVDAYQIWEARVAGADAVLLIAAALDDDELVQLMDHAERAGLEALVEVHDEEELGRAVAAGATVVGVNNRDLKTLAVDLATSRRLAPLMPRNVTAVAESGLQTAADVRALQELGYRGFLIGERFMSVEDPGAALADLAREVGRVAGGHRCA